MLDKSHDILMTAVFLVHELIARKCQYLEAQIRELVVHLSQSFIILESKFTFWSDIDNQDGFFIGERREIN